MNNSGENVQILAIDTSTESCSVGLLNDQSQSSLIEMTPRKHAALVLPMVHELLEKQQMTLKQLSAIAVTVGPGSFTGIRIGVSVVKGLAFALNKPVIPLSTLQVLANGAHRITGLSKIMAGIDARMGEIYWGEYCVAAHSHVVVKQTPEKLISPAEAGEILQSNQNQAYAYAGTAFSHYCQSELAENPLGIASGILFPQPEDLLSLAAAAWQKQQIIMPQQLEPIYLRDNVVHQVK